jgi:hypothetical protein
MARGARQVILPVAFSGCAIDNCLGIGAFRFYFGTIGAQASNIDDRQTSEAPCGKFFLQDQGDIFRAVSPVFSCARCR